MVFQLSSGSDRETHTETHTLRVSVDCGTKAHFHYITSQSKAALAKYVVFSFRGDAFLLTPRISHAQKLRQVKCLKLRIDQRALHRVLV